MEEIALLTHEQMGGTFLWSIIIITGQADDDYDVIQFSCPVFSYIIFILKIKKDIFHTYRGYFNQGCFGVIFLCV